MEKKKKKKRTKIYFPHTFVKPMIRNTRKTLFLLLTLFDIIWMFLLWDIQDRQIINIFITTTHMTNCSLSLDLNKSFNNTWFFPSELQRIDTCGKSHDTSSRGLIFASHQLPILMLHMPDSTLFVNASTSSFINFQAATTWSSSVSVDPTAHLSI